MPGCNRAAAGRLMTVWPCKAGRWAPSFAAGASCGTVRSPGRPTASPCALFDVRGEASVDVDRLRPRFAFTAPGVHTLSVVPEHEFPALAGVIRRFRLRDAGSRDCDEAGDGRQPYKPLQSIHGFLHQTACNHVRALPLVPS